MIKIGSKVRVKSISEIIDQNIHECDPRNNVPYLYSELSDDEMKIFSGDYVGFVECSSTELDADGIPRNFVTVDDTWIYLFEKDIEILSESEIDKFDVGDMVILKWDDRRYHGQVGEVTSKNKSGSSINYKITVLADDIQLTLKLCDIEPYYDGYVAPPLPIIVTCDRCGSIITYANREEKDAAGKDFCLCEECRKREYITPYHRYDPPIEFRSTENDSENNLYFGVELEVDEGGERDSNAKGVMKILNKDNKLFTHCSHDGSLNCGFEIITQPATIEYHRGMESTYKEAFKYLVSKGYRSHNTGTCGIHIHFSRAYYADNEEANIAKLLYLVEKFWDELVVFSRRDYRSLDSYAKKIDSSSSNFIRTWNKSGNHSGHYYAVNISNENTIELRIFRGTLNLKTYMATLEFVNSLVRTAKEKTVEELHDLKFEELLCERSVEYYASRTYAAEFESEN